MEQMKIPIRRRTRIFLQECVRDRGKYAMMLPFYILFGLFTLAPIIISIVLSFTDFNMMSMPNFVWLDNYRKILLEDKGKISLTPNGNGGWFSSLQRNGMINEMKAMGIEWLNVFSVDNVLQDIGDPVFLGATLEQGHSAGAKVIAKVNPDEKVGAICLRNGRPSVVEYSELTDELRNAKDENGNYKYNFGVTLNYLFNIPVTEESAKGQMPIHRANKKIDCIDAQGNPVKPEEPNGYKLETFIFDILAFYEGVTVFEIVREDEFAPIKNATGVDSLESARELLVRKTGIEL